MGFSQNNVCHIRCYFALQLYFSFLYYYHRIYRINKCIQSIRVKQCVVKITSLRRFAVHGITLYLNFFPSEIKHEVFRKQSIEQYVRVQQFTATNIRLGNIFSSQWSLVLKQNCL